MHRLERWLADPYGRAGAWLLAGATALLLLPGIGLYPLFDVDEGAFSEATRELLRSGDWLSTTLNGLPRYDKPILIYWLQAASVLVFGLDEFALRLPSALAGIAWVAAIVRFAAPRLGADTGLLAGWVAASSLGVMAMSRAATADALLNALLVATMFDLWRYFEAQEAAALPGAGRAALRRCYLWMGLGVLTKGPIALLIPGAASLLWSLSRRRLWAWRRAVTDLPGWLVLLLVAAPWYVAQWHLHGREFVDGFLVRHNLDRFQGTLEGHGGSLGYYVLLVPLLLLPWSGLLWQGLRAARRDWGDPLARYLLAWFGFVFVFFSLSGTKLPHYVLYGMTPLFLLAARSARAAGGARNLLSLPCLLLLLLPAVPLAVQWWSSGTPSARQAFYFAQAQRAATLATDGAYYPVTLGCALAGIALACATGLGPARRALGATAALAVALAYGFVPWLGETLNGPVRDAGRLAAARGGAAVQWNITAPSFSVYRRDITPARPPQAGELALTRTDRLPADAPVQVLLREGGVALVLRLPEAAAPQ